MRYVKLQFGCLLVILYIMIAYLRAVKRGKTKTCMEYNLLMIMAPLAVILAQSQNLWDLGFLT